MAGATGTQAGRHHSKTVHKAVQLLRALAEPPETAGVTELARRLGLQKSVVHSLLATLAYHGLVEQDPETRQYRLGMGVFQLGQVVARRLSLHNVARPVMEELANQVLHSVHLVSRQGRIGVCVEEVIPPGRFRLTLNPGSTAPLHAGASFKAILAFLTVTEIDDYLNTPLERFTDATICDPRRLREELAAIRRQGYAVSHGELCPGASAVAAPIRNHDGRVVASISVAELTPQLELGPGLAAAVTAAAGRISAALGYQDAAPAQA